MPKGSIYYGKSPFTSKKQARKASKEWHYSGGPGKDLGHLLGPESPVVTTTAGKHAQIAM